MKKVIALCILVTMVTTSYVLAVTDKDCLQYMRDGKDFYNDMQYEKARELFEKTDGFSNSETWIDACDERLREVEVGIINREEEPIERTEHPNQQIYIGSGKIPLLRILSMRNSFSALFIGNFWMANANTTITEATLSEQWDFYRQIDWLHCSKYSKRVPVFYENSFGMTIEFKSGKRKTHYDTCSYYIDPWSRYWRKTDDPMWKGPMATEQEYAQALEQHEHTTKYTKSAVIDVASVSVNAAAAGIN